MTSASELPARLASWWPVDRWREVTVLAAVSGGADSVALFRALHALKHQTGGAGRLLVAHYNHRLRGAAADADEQFVRSLCDTLNVRCVVERAREATLAKAAEAQLRKDRYRFLTRACGEAGARYLVTAHTADDQAETVLHRAARGTSLRGLAGIPRLRTLRAGIVVVRPFLKARRAELEAYLASLSQAHRQDESNLGLQYTRNRIRRRVIPELEIAVNPGVVPSLARLAELAQQANEVIGDAAQTLHDRAVCDNGEGATRIDLVALGDARPYLVGELLSLVWRRRGWPRERLTASHLSEMAALLLMPFQGDVHRTLPGNIFCVRRPEEAVLFRSSSGASG